MLPPLRSQLHPLQQQAPQHLLLQRPPRLPQTLRPPLPLQHLQRLADARVSRAPASAAQQLLRP